MDNSTLNYELLFENLTPLFQEKKWELFKRVISNRTRYLTIVLEDIYQRQNASAVLRTAECYGIQDIHIIENENECEISPKVALGASKWMNLHYYNNQENNTLTAIKKLKKQGYRVVATSPHETSKSIQELDVISGKIALVFGNEVEGISDCVKENADEFVNIPMTGFTESFNVSVSAAICIHELVEKLKSENIDFKLSSEEQNVILLDWMTKTIAKGEKVVPEVMKMIELTK